MASPLTVYKLTVLYLLDRAQEALSQSLISSFLLEKGYANLISLMQTYEEMAANGLITAEDREGTAFLTVTDEGRESLRFFRSELSEAIRKEADAFLKENGLRLARERELAGDYYKRSGSDYVAHMAVMENSLPVFEINLSVQDEAAAKRAIARWKSQSTDLYRIITEKLF